jgi:hypothetical protein
MKAMQKIIGTIVLLAGMMFLTYSCYYEYPPTPLPIEPQDVSFNTHILPILVSKCSTPECHDGTRIPNLLPDQAYNSLKSGGYYNLTFPEDSRLYTAIDVGVEGLLMPPSGSLSQLEKDLILIWISKGAPND